MSFFADLAGKAENLLNNLDEQTGAALRSHNVGKLKILNKNDSDLEPPQWQKSKRSTRSPVRKASNIPEIRSTSPPKRIAPPSRISVNNNKNDCSKESPTRLRKSPTRKGNVTNYTLNHCPRTQVREDIMKEKNEVYLQDTDLKKRSKCKLFILCFIHFGICYLLAL